MTIKENYKFCLRADKPSFFILALLGAVALAGVIGLPAFVIGAFFLFIRDKDFLVSGLLLFLGAPVAVFMMFHGGGFRRQWRMRKRISDHFVAFTDKDFIYQTDNVLGELAKIIIPINKIIKIDLYTEPDFWSGNYPDHRYARVTYFNSEGQEDKLDIDWSFATKKGMLSNVLENELRQIRGE